MHASEALATSLLAELVHQGVTQVVLSPGSRSAPLAFAARRLAARGAIELHVRVDERSAGFLALGLAKVSRIPVPVICTSGTAVANLMPAIVEARYCAVPLIALTADRPAGSRGVGSPQTIDQVGFFGANVVFEADLATPDRHSGDTGYGDLQRSARAAAAAGVGAVMGATGAGPCAGPGAHGALRMGPGHINVGFTMPLVPALPVAGGRGGQTVPHTPPRRRRPPLTGCDCRDITEVLGHVPARGVIVVGDLPTTSLRGHHQWLAALASGCGWPIIAEPSSNVHSAPTALQHGVVVLGTEDFMAAHQPELVLSVGLFGLSRPTMELLRSAQTHVAIDLPGVGRTVCDPLRTAHQVLDAIPLPPPAGTPEGADCGSEEPPSTRLESLWLADWLRADAAAAGEIVADLARRSGGEVGDSGGTPHPINRLTGEQIAVPRGTFTGVQAAVEVAQSVPRGGVLMVGASWPVRHLEAFAAIPSGVVVIGNRGTNGIDGVISTAWGAAIAHQRLGGGPAFALLGDLTFLHDHGGLVVPPGSVQPNLTIVVLDNDGGGIFSQLEQGRPEFADDFDAIFATRHGLDLVGVGRAAGWPSEAVTSVAELRESLRAAAESDSGVRIVIARLETRAKEAAHIELLLQKARSAVQRSQRLTGSKRATRG